MVGAIATQPSRFVQVVVKSPAKRRFGSGTATWPRMGSPGSESRARTSPWALMSAWTRLRETTSPFRLSVAQTFRTPHAGSAAMTSRIASSTTSLGVYLGGRRSATTFAAVFGFFAA